MSKKNNGTEKFGVLDLLQLFCYSFVCAVLGFVLVWVFFRIVDSRPENVCSVLGQSFKMNDTFDFSGCRLENDDSIVLVLDVKKGMESYFEDADPDVTEDELSSTQLDYYCSEFFDHVRINNLDLNIRIGRKTRQQIHVSRNVCM